MRKVDIGIVCAVPEEFQALSKYLNSATSIDERFQGVIGNIGNSTVVLIRSGIGCEYAAAATTTLILKYSPKYIIFSGVAGALDQSLINGQIILGSEIFLAEAETHEQLRKIWEMPPLKMEPDKDLFRLAQSSFSGLKYTVSEGVIVTSNLFPAPPSYQSLFKKHAAVAIDMESASFGKVCNLYQVPWCVVRSISNPVNSHEQEDIEEDTLSLSANNAAHFTNLLVNEILKNEKKLQLSSSLFKQDQKESKDTNLHPQAQKIVRKFDLARHPEGGYYKQTHKSKTNINDVSHETKSSGTSIYFLLSKEHFSAWHRIKSDETWNFHSGTTLLLYVIDENKELITIRLNNDPDDHSSQTQYTVKAGLWFAAECDDKEGFSFVGCAVYPGFEYRDFELGKISDLVKQYPKHTKIIERLSISSPIVPLVEHDSNTKNIKIMAKL